MVLGNMCIVKGEFTRADNTDSSVKRVPTAHEPLNKAWNQFDERKGDKRNADSKHRFCSRTASLIAAYSYLRNEDEHNPDSK
jgi:hypothetical protein